MIERANEQWTSRLGYILASIGMAVGTGNIWRFPRMAAQHGGGSFLVGWAIFLFLWAFPLIAIEMMIGRKSRKGTIGSFRQFLGSRYTWMGGFVALVCLFIAFYYSVVVGWTFNYFIYALKGAFHPDVDTNLLWLSFSHNTSRVLFFHLIAILAAGTIVHRGINRGIEKVSMVLLPFLFALLIVAAVRSLTLDGALEGVVYMFTPSMEYLGRAETWLQALTQSAWSTGAGWGLYATYAIYTHQQEDVTQNALTAGFGNNSVELLAGLTIIPAIFALAPSAEYMDQALSSGNVGITFIYMAELFSMMPGGYWMALVFFGALATAAISPLVAMLELAVRNLVDVGIKRQLAIWVVVAVVFFGGVPSAISLEIFANQDWVWGIGLLFSCLFYAIVAIHYGVETLRSEINSVSDIRVAKVWSKIVVVCVPIIFVVFLMWWTYQSINDYPQSFWDPRNLESIGTVVVQLGLGLGVVYLLNPWINKWYKSTTHEKARKFGKGASI